jgi:hypothetical protein
MSPFNATPALSETSPDFIRKDVIQDFVLASFASFRVTTPETLIDCIDPTCVGLRIHDILEYTIVPPSNWSSNDPVPDYSATWKSDFDPQDDWDVFTVSNASTLVFCVGFGGVQFDRLSNIRISLPGIANLS